MFINYMFGSPIDFNEFKQFMLDNKILSTIIGLAVGLSAKDLIDSTVGDIFLPGLYFLVFRHFSTKYAGGVFEPMNRLNLSNFIEKIISFFLVVVISFFVLNHIIKKWIDYDTTASSRRDVTGEPKK
jgi:large-conductance mechanosensitive channel